MNKCLGKESSLLTRDEMLAVSTGIPAHGDELGSNFANEQVLLIIVGNN